MNTVKWMKNHYDPYNVSSHRKTYMLFNLFIIVSLVLDLLGMSFPVSASANEATNSQVALQTPSSIVELEKQFTRPLIQEQPARTGSRHSLDEYQNNQGFSEVGFQQNFTQDLLFIENDGQFNEKVKFKSNHFYGAVTFEENAIWITKQEAKAIKDPEEEIPGEQEINDDLGKDKQEKEKRKGVNLQYSFIGANPSPIMEGFDLAGSNYSYILGDNPENWKVGVSTWRGIRYVDLYPGVNLEITSKNDQWIWRLVILDKERFLVEKSEKRSPEIRMKVEGANLLERKNHHYSAKTDLGDIDLPPIEIVFGSETTSYIVSEPTIEKNEIAIAYVDDSENYLLTETTEALLNSEQSALETNSTGFSPNSFSVVLNGDWNDEIGDISVDEAGFIYVVGDTASANFPVTPGAFQTPMEEDCQGYYEISCNVFVSKISPTGNIIYSTFFGGSNREMGQAIAVDDTGTAFILGRTWSLDFPGDISAGNHNPNNVPNVFYVALNESGSALVFANVIDNQKDDWPIAANIEVSPQNEVYLLWTSKFTPIDCNIPAEVSLAKVDRTTGSLLFSKVVERSHIEGADMEIAPNGELYIVASYWALGCPGFQSDGLYFARFTNTGNKIISTFVSWAPPIETAWHIEGDLEVDKAGDAYVISGFNAGRVTKLGPDGQVKKISSFSLYHHQQLEISPFGEIVVIGASDFDDGEYGEQILYKLRPRDLSIISSTPFYGKSYLSYDKKGNLYIAYTDQELEEEQRWRGRSFVTKLVNTGPTVSDDSTNSKECDPGCPANSSQGYSEDPINTRTGALDYDVEDLSVFTAAGPLTFKRFYSSSAIDQFTLPMGSGWTHNHDVRLIFPGQPGSAPDAILYKSFSQNVYRFFDNGSGVYTAEPGVLSNLSRQSGSPVTYTITAPSQSVHTFDENGKLISWTDGQGHFWEYSYSGDLLDRITDLTSGNYLDFDYDGSYLDRVFDQAGRDIHFEYSNGDLISFTDVLDHQWTYTYDPDHPHHLREIIDPASKVIVRTEYDEQGRAIEQFDNQGIKTTAITYSADGVSTLLDANGNSSTHLYHDRNILMSSEGGAGNASTQLLDDQFRPTVLGDPLGRTSDMLWSADGKNLEKYIDPAGGETDLFYDSQNNLTSVVDSRGFETQYEYSGTLITGIRDPYTADADLSYVYTYTTDEDAPQPPNLLKSVRDPSGNLTQYAYNTAGLKISETDASSRTTYYRYDPVGRLVAVEQPSGQTDWTCYDPAGRIVRTVMNASGDGLSQTTNPCDAANYQPSSDPYFDLTSSTVFDLSGNVIASIDPSGIISRTYYDASNRPVTRVQNLSRKTIEDPAPPDRNPSSPIVNIRTDFVYDANSNLIATIDELGIITRTYFDAENRPQYVVQNLIDQTIEVAQPPLYDPAFPDQNIRSETVYDLAGNAIAFIDPNGVITRTYYDELNRPVSVVQNLTDVQIADNTPPTRNPTSPDQNVRSDTVYDLNGNVIASIDPKGIITRTYYDALNRPVSIIQNLVGWNIATPYPLNFDPAFPDRNVRSDNVYDKSGILIAVIDPSGVITRTYFDALNRPSIVVRNLQGVTIESTAPPAYDPAFPDKNVQSRMVYDSLGRSIASIDVNGVITRTYYDGNNRPNITVQNLVGQLPETEIPPVYDPSYPDQNIRTEMVYDRLGRQIATIDNAGTITRTYYDALGRSYLTVRNLTVAEISDPTPPAFNPAYPDQNVRAESVYDISGRLFKTIDAVGVTTVTCFDRVGRAIKTVRNPSVADACHDYAPTSETDQDIVSKTTYDAAGNRLSVQDPNGKITEYQYDRLYRVLSEKDPLQHITSYTYDAAGNQLTREDARNIITRYEYDALYRLKIVEENSVADVEKDQETNVRTEYIYDVMGNRTKIINGLGYATVFAYDSLGRLILERDPIYLETKHVYDAAGNRLQTRDANGQTTIYAYDGLGRLALVDYPEPDSDVTFTYDASGNRKTLQDGTGTTRWEYDGLNRPVKIMDPSNIEVKYLYDAIGHRTELVYPGEKQVSYSYDDAGRLHQVTDWDNRHTQYSYDKAGRPHMVQLPNGILSNYVYDDANRLTSITHAAGTQTIGSYAYAYDDVGNRTQAIETVLPAFVESGSNYLPLVCYGCGEEAAYPAPPEASPDGMDGFSTDQNAYPAPGEGSFDTTDPESGVPDGAGGNAYPAPEETTGPETSIGIWDKIVQFFQALFQTPTASAAALKTESYDRALVLSDSQRLATSLEATAFHPVIEQTLKTVQIDYQYDHLYRLKSAAYGDGTSFAYTYDAVGNRLTEAVTGGVTTTYTYDDANRLSSVNGVPYTWDNNGNLLSDGENTYIYDHANRLVSVIREGMTASYQYNGLGDRVRETNNGETTNFTLDLNTGLTQVLADGTNTYLYGTARIGQFTASDSAYFLGDALGSVRQLVDGAGVVTMAKSYEPYGEVLSAAGSGSSVYGFTNEYTSQDLIYLRARWYSPLDGRFLTKDSWQGDYFNPSSYNSWVYGYANPIRYTDPSGYSPQGPIDFFKCFSIVAIGGPAEWLVTAEEAVNICRNAYNKELWNLASGNALPTNTFELWSWYLNENGDEHLYFDGNQILTRELAKSLSIHDIRLEFYKHGDQNKTLYKANVPEVLGGLIFDIRNSWISVNLPITFFLGSYWYQVRELPNGRVGFRIDNDTTLESGTHFAGRFPDQGFQGSIEDLIDQKPEIGNEPLSKVLNEYPVISILRSQTRSETNGALGGGTMFQTFTWTEKQNECFTQLYPWQILESVLDIQVWNDFQAYTDDIFIP